MKAYWRAVLSHLGLAAYDVLFVAFFSLAPLLLGRLVAVINKTSTEDYWAFLSNGQLAFFSMGSLATLALLCLRKKLPDAATLWIGLGSIACMLFLVALVAVDPTLQKGEAFVGAVAFWLYLGVLVIRILADAMKSVNSGDALQAGNAMASRLQSELQRRKEGAQ
jgi:peptidoglycan/LPS O-acetylase OafA/YrhL